MKTRLRRLLAAAATVVVGGGLAMAIAPGTANAGYVETNCTVREGGPFILYYNSWQEGAGVCLNGTFSSLAGFNFDNSGLDGSGQPVINNAASAANLDTVYLVRIWSGYNSTGVFQGITPCCDQGSALNLGAVTNKNKSISWVRY